jgi:polyribonucleotide nucleotidyltransferase
MRIKDKLENYATVDKVMKDFVTAYPDDDAERKADAKTIAKGLKEKILRDEILERGQRLDGRKFDEIRNITIEVGVLPRTHGSCLFTRGETQALVVATLGTADDQQKVETVDGETWKRFMLHYNFPPFSVGEVKFLRGPGPPRDRPRRARGARARADDAGRRELPLHRARRLGDHREQRLLVDGVGLRRVAGDDGCRRAAQGAGRRRGDGPGDERGDRQVRRS